MLLDLDNLPSDPALLHRLVRDMAAVANSNVKERVRLLNGKLIVRTSPGRGTEVAVQVPVPARAH